MGDNVLAVGKPRLGWFADGNPNTPETATLLQDDGCQITLTVPWIEVGPPGQYQRWFYGTTARFGDDPDRTRFTYKVPGSLSFADVDGHVALVGCRAAGMRHRLAAGPGQGIVNVQVAVLGARGLDYGRINGLRSAVPGLGGWVGLRSLTEEVTTDGAGRVKAVDLRLESPSLVKLARNLNLCLHPNFGVSKPAEADTTSLHESLEIQTLVKQPRGWEEHLGAHNTVRDLVDIAAWRPFGYSQQTAHRSDDPERVLSGELIGPKWAPVRTHAVRSHEPFADRPQFLFSFPDVGTAGFKRWVRLRERYWRGVSPMLSILDQKGAYVDTRLVQSGIGLDGIGYQVALDARVRRDLADRESYAMRLGRIVSQLLVEPPFDPEAWIRRSASAYNAAKHADREMVDVLTRANTLRENILVFRLWIAGQVGVTPETLARNLPLARRFHGVPVDGGC